MINQYKFLSGVAGVSFANDITDGGKDRQEILRGHAIDGKEITAIADLENCTYIDPKTGPEKAIKVKINNEVIGFVPRTKISELENIAQCLVKIGYYNKADKFTANLYEWRKPSPKQYSYVMDIVRKTGQTAPIYTAEEYSAFIIKNQFVAGRQG